MAFLGLLLENSLNSYPGITMSWFYGERRLPHSIDKYLNSVRCPKINPPLSLSLGFPLTQLGFCLQWRRPGFDPWVGKIHWRRVLQPTPVFLPEEFHGEEPGWLWSMRLRRVGHNCSDLALPLVLYQCLRFMVYLRNCGLLCSFKSQLCQNYCWPIIIF